MKKQIKSTTKAHLIRGAFYLLLLLAVCAIPFALAERSSAKRSVLKPLAARNPGSNVYATQVASAAAASAATDRPLNHGFVSDRAQKQEAPRSKPIRPAVPLGVDCNDPTIIKHDDGTIENGGSGNPALVTEVRFADKFTPTSYPNSYSSVCLDFVTLAGGPPTYPVDIVVYDDDGAGGSPGTLLGSLNAQPATTHVFMAGQTPIWNSYDISGLGLNITSGSVYIGARWVPPTPTNVYMSFDQSTDRPVGFAGGYWWNNNANAWATIQTAFPNYRSCMIRAFQGTAPTGTPSPTPTPTCQVTYTTATGTGAITAGGTDIGNHCDDCNTQINLPFPVSVYGNPPISVASVGSNGDIQFTATPSTKVFYWQQCVPVDPDPASQGPFLNTLFPYYDDLRTDDLAACPDCGIFTQTLGTAPNRQFVIRWKTTYFNFTGTAEFEVLLTEGSNTLSVIYGPNENNGATATSGIQQDLTLFTLFSCFEPVLTPTLRVDYIPTGCGSPTPTPTATCSPSATATPTATASGTASPTATPSGTISPTATPSATASPTATPSATPSATGSPSATPTVTPSGTPTATPTPSGTPGACVRGQGFWKNHPDQWPVTELQLGNVTYNQQQLLDILHEPVRGNGLLILAHQLIAAKLNIAAGADPSCIKETIAAADALIGDLVIPPVGDGYLRPRDAAPLAGILGRFNEGHMCAPACDQGPRPTETPMARGRPMPVPRPR